MMLQPELEKQTEETTRAIISRLKEIGWTEPTKTTPSATVDGEALVEANSILGIEKYLGMVDKKLRIAYFSSIKLTNNSTVTRTYVKFDASLQEDLVYIAGKEAGEKERNRILTAVNAYRELTGINSKILYASQNTFKGGNEGKGLGTSAAAGAALGAALVQASMPKLFKETYFVESIARLVAGSAPQSIAGGFSVWLSDASYLKKPNESYSVRIDKGDFDVKLVVIPIPQVAKTEDAHEAAVKSPHYLEWVKKKCFTVPHLMEAIINKDLQAIGEHAEEDSQWLNKIITTGGGINNWVEDTESLRQAVINLRKKQGLLAYYSMDTGPSIAVLTNAHDAEAVKNGLEEALDRKYAGKAFIAEMGGGPKILDPSKKTELIRT
ncbi:MAG: hypothetical protein ABH803_02760 [Candidatus Micrarchaeota archaeon]